MNWAMRRRLIYIGGLLAVLAVILAPIALSLRPEPSCFDGKQNQDERGIDCGGSCAKICANDTSDMQVSWVRSFMVGGGVASAVAYVTNPNPALGAHRVPFEFKLYDSQNILITAGRGVTDIPPGVSFPIYLGGIGVAERVPVRALFSFTENPQWQKETMRVPLSIANKKLEEGAAPRLTADIRNDGVTPLSAIDVVAVVFDLEGNAFAASQTFIETLGGGAAKQIVFTWPTTFLASSTRIDIYPKLRSF